MNSTISTKTWLHILLIAVAGLLIYSNTFHVPFLWDDRTSIVENPVIKSMENFFLNAKGYEYNPRRFIGYLTFALNYFIGGLDVTGYHVVNLAVHILNALLVYTLILLTFRTPQMKDCSLAPFSGLLALCASLLFVVHPLQTQAVTYIVQRLTSLTAMWYLLSLCLYAGWRLAGDRSPSHGRKALPLYVLSLITIILAMKTKEIAFTLPVIVVLYDFFFFRERKPLWLVPVLLTLLIIPVSMLNLEKPAGMILSDVSQVTRVQAQTSRWVYLMTQFTVIVTYIRLLLLPIDQNLDYDYPLAHGFFTLPVLLSFAVLLSLVLLAAYFFVRSGRKDEGSRPELRLVSFGIFWFFITLSVESSIIPIVDPIFEHRAYLPSVGFFIAVATGLFLVMERVNNRRVVHVTAGVVVVIVLVLGGTTYARNRVWQDETRLWEDVVNKSPLKARPHFNLAVAYTKERRTEDAVREYEKAIEIDPDHFKARNNLGLDLARLGRTKEAIQEYVKAIGINPDYPEAHYNLGIAYASQGRREDAIREYEKAIEKNPDYFEAHTNLGVMYATLGRTEDAVREYTRALQINPGYLIAYYNRGLAFSSLGRYKDAEKDFLAALRINPGFYQAHYDLGLAYRVQGRFDEAVREFQSVLSVNPNHRGARENLKMLKGMIK